ncbi:MAG TPA: histidine kinase dimerization/phosphoacceptor domain-containing protein [Anaerolineales bacterium]|nr:histidine kinase dimerization/phosphoacceptor domain-containing protein [Anaerolineales bacterium]
MTRSAKKRKPWGIYIFGLILLIITLLRVIGNFSGHPGLPIALAALALFSTFYLLEFFLSTRLVWPWWIYFILQSGLVVLMSSLQPFLDVVTSLFILLAVQAFHNLSRRAASLWALLFIVAPTAALMQGQGLVSGLAVSMLIVAEGTFLVSYDLLAVQAQKDQEESQALLAGLQEAYQQLKEYTAQAEELIAARERNQLARELHDSVGQIIFSITLTSQSARQLLERDPARVPEQIERLQKMTENALSQLRSLIAQLRPPQK